MSTTMTEPNPDDYTTTTMYLTAAGVEEVRRLISYPNTLSVLFHLSDQTDIRKVEVRHHERLTGQLLEIKGDGECANVQNVFDALVTKEQNQKQRVQDVKRAHPHEFPKRITPADQAKILKLTNLRTIACLVYSNREKTKYLFEAFAKLVKVFNTEDNAELAGDVYMTVRYYPDDFKLSCIQIVNHNEDQNGHYAVLALVQKTISNYPLYMAFKCEALRHANYRLKSEDLTLGFVRGSVMAARGPINAKSERFIGPIDNILKMSRE